MLTLVVPVRMSGGGEKTGASSDVKEKSDGGWVWYA